ncbi:hypothetical protein C0J45_13043 [Silurus meridionalis]|uniref:Ig-like domain-containing protein n=1 Tax=Silurus meridionalis TaxID=175797 RepID=A0A8T0AY30_SILME|nr:hypothetical protein HF521_004915 [Silurus meridionalis]KAI5097734.1 hypothetical protein C0J45_13043 [Silurus meridionalis]
MLPVYFLVLLGATSSVFGAVDFTQPGHVIVQPGQALTIACKVSGWSLTDSSYCTNWIRHATGKAMQWIGYICSSGATGFTDSLKNRFSITQDTSSNTVTLNGQNVQMEDTAVYYCVRYNDTVMCLTRVPVQKPFQIGFLAFIIDVIIIFGLKATN